MRNDLVKLATEELWEKVGDMHLGHPLEKEEWLAVIENIRQRMEKAKIQTSLAAHPTRGKTSSAKKSG